MFKFGYSWGFSFFLLDLIRRSKWSSAVPGRVQAIKVDQNKLRPEDHQLNLYCPNTDFVTCGHSDEETCYDWPKGKDKDDDKYKKWQEKLRMYAPTRVIPEWSQSDPRVIPELSLSGPRVVQSPEWILCLKVGSILYIF